MMLLSTYSLKIIFVCVRMLVVLPEELELLKLQVEEMVVEAVNSEMLEG